MKRSIAYLVSGKLFAAVGGAMLLTLASSVNSATAQIADKYADKAKVVEFAINNMGRRIGRGECTDLVNAALEYAGARQLEKRSKNRVELMLEEKTGAKFPDEIYVWGLESRILGKNHQRRFYAPGHILQFEGCRFEKPDGTAWWEMPHHTAIVKNASGSYVTLLHQNAPPGSGVNETSLDLLWLVPPGAGVTHGRIKVYNPRKL